MLDILFLAGFAALPIATWLTTRSLLWTSARLILAFGLAGNAVQTSIAWGMDWSTRGLQVLALALMILVLALAVLRRRPVEGLPGLRRQLWGVVAPAVTIGVFLLGMRLLAPETASPLSGVGYLINHPLAEDNAKWLHLTSQLASGDPITFNGYAGGPLLLLMSAVAALISVLSLALLGGVNEVAVAVNTLIGTQFLLIALVPFALAPFAEGAVRGAGSRRPLRIPVPLLWAGALVLFAASAVVTSYGHLSFQFILIVLTLWAAVFLMPGRDGFSRIVMTLAIATSASVWVPLNVLGLALIAAVLIWAVRRRVWTVVGLALLTLVVSWDSLLSSTLYLLGIDVGTDGGARDAASGAMAGDAAAASSVSLPPQVLAATHLFEAPGGTEIVQPLVGGLAIAAVLTVAALHPRVREAARQWRGVVPLLPIAALGMYVVLISVGDGVITGSAPHYGGHKLAFAWTVTALAASFPLAIALFEPRFSSMTVFRWLAVGAVGALLTLDTILPRAVSALSPKLWPGVDAASPAYWVPAEVKDQPDQPISSLPVACIFAPPQSDSPSALPLGQQSYTCTRLLTGLNGLEGRAGTLSAWLATEWMSNQHAWDEYQPSLVDTTQDLRGRSVILMTPEYGVAGLSPWGAVLDRNTPPVD